MSCFDSSFSNNGNFESFFEIFVKVENSNDCFDFVGGIRGLGELEKRVNSGEMKVALNF